MDGQNNLKLNKENCALKLVDEIILYYDARSKKNKKTSNNLKLVKEVWSFLKEKRSL